MTPPSQTWKLRDNTFPLFKPLDFQWFVLVQSLSRVRLCDYIDCSTSGFPVLHQLPEFAQAHVHWVSDAIQPGQNTGAGCYSLLQGISPTQRWNPGFLHCRQILYCLSLPGNPGKLIQGPSRCKALSDSEGHMPWIPGDWPCLSDGWDRGSHRNSQERSSPKNWNGGSWKLPEGAAALKDPWGVPRHPVLQPWDEWSPDSPGSCWDAHVMPCGADLGKSLESPGISPAFRVPKCLLSAHSNQEPGGEGNQRACVSRRFSDAG